MSAKRPAGKRRQRAAYDAHLFAAEAEYAESLVQAAIGDQEGSIAALRRSHQTLPTYAPATLSLGSVEYQIGRRAEGLRLFRSLLDLPKDTEDLCLIIDRAGDFLIHIGAHADGLELYRLAATRFPRFAAFHQGLGCCAGHLGRHDEALDASRAALELEPGNQQFMNDLGWCLCEAGRLDDALPVLLQAVDMDPENELARENVRYLRSLIDKSRPTSAPPHRRRHTP